MNPKGTIIKGTRSTGTIPTISIKKHGRAVLNRPAMRFLDHINAERVLLWWDEGTMILSVQGLKDGEDHAESLKLARGEYRSMTTGGFSLRSKLTTIGYTFDENRGPFTGEVNVETNSIEFKLPKHCFKSKGLPWDEPESAEPAA